MSDGRVVKLGVLGTSDASSPQTVLEMSDANGNSWQRMPDIGPHGMRLNDRLRVFLVDDELFVYGEMELAHNNSEGVGVQWLNINTAQWEVLWEADPKDNWRDHVGRVLVKRLGNGKTVVLPVGAQ